MQPASAEAQVPVGLRVTFQEQAIICPEEPDEEEPDAHEEQQLSDCFGADGTAVCAVCLCRVSRDSTLAAGAATATADHVVAAAAAAADAEEGGQDVEQGGARGERGALVPPASPRGDVSLTQTGLRLQCNHVFHVDCLSLWMKRASRPTCPTCRALVAPARLAPQEASSPEIRELVERTVSPPTRPIRWHLPVVVGGRRASRTPSQGPAATTLGSRWQCKQIVANVALHLGYPVALFSGVGGLLYLWTQC
jgi:hypothetical protein